MSQSKETVAQYILDLHQKGKIKWRRAEWWKDWDYFAFVRLPGHIRKTEITLHEQVWGRGFMQIGEHLGFNTKVVDTIIKDLREKSSYQAYLEEQERLATDLSRGILKQTSYRQLVRGWFGSK
jgi:hypothetical protein